MQRHGTHREWGETSVLIRYVDISEVEVLVVEAFECILPFTPCTVAEQAGVVGFDDACFAVELSGPSCLPRGIFPID